jgi:hypothetical protein
MSTSHHGIRPAVKARRAVGGAVAFVAVCEAAHVVSVLAGPRSVMAGAAVIVAVFTACWIIFRVRPVLRPADRARRCEPAAVPVLAESQEPARLAA